MWEGNLSFLSGKMFYNLGITSNLETDSKCMRKKWNLHFWNSPLQEVGFRNFKYK